MTTDLPAYLDAQLAAIEDTARAASPHCPWTVTSSGWVDTPSGEGEDWISLRQNLDYGPDIASEVLCGDPEFDDQSIADFKHIARMDPAFTLAWCAAIRAVIALHAEEGVSGDPWNYCAECKFKHAARDEWPCDTLRRLARPFAGGDGWQEGWTL